MPGKAIDQKPSGKKATITFPPDLFGILQKLAKDRQKTIGELVLEAVRDRYRMHTKADKMKIIEEMKKADFPFWTWQEIEKDYEECLCVNFTKNIQHHLQEISSTSP